MNCAQARRAALIDLKGQFGQLCTHGLEPLSSDGRWQTVGEVREYLSRPEVAEAITICLEWLDQCSVVKRPTPGRDSYSYKHEVEQWAGRAVPHLAMLVAAQMAGLALEPNPDRLWAALLPLGSKRPGAVL